MHRPWRLLGLVLVVSALAGACARFTASRCPPGAELAGTQGRELWCERQRDDGTVVKDGRLEAWFPNGQKSTEGTFRDGMRHGQWRSWYDSGQQASEQNYRDGKPDGLQKRWYPDGKPQLEVTFQDGMMNGPSHQWWPNGKKWKEGAYHDNAEAGVWTCWAPTGMEQDCERDQGMEIE